MYNNPYNYPYPRIANSYIRVLHASPDAPPVDVYANDNLVVRNLPYRQFTEYKKVPSGAYNIKVYPIGQTVNPIINKNVNIPENSIFTGAIVGKLANIDLLPVPDPVMQIPTGKTYLRFVHLSPDSPSVDVALPDGSVLFRNIGFKGISDYIPVNPGTYAFYVKPTGTNNTVLYVPNIQLQSDKFYTIYAIGLISGSPGLQVLIPLDGNTYIKF